MHDARPPVVPLISSSVAGPLGIAHLPRLWLKMLLHAQGRLAEGYRHGSGGFDELLCTRLGLDLAALDAFVATEEPDYSAYERYVAEHARDLSPGTIALINHRVRTGDMGEKNAAERRAQFGIAEASFANATALNDLDDWAATHASLARERAR